MNTPEHDDWERLFRQRLANLEARSPADALTRILAVANPLSAPVAQRPGSVSKTFGVGGMVAVLLGIWLMQATQRPYHALTESAQISRKTTLSTGRRPSGYTSLAKGKQEPEPPLNRDTRPIATSGFSVNNSQVVRSSSIANEPPAAPLTLGSPGRRISGGSVARTQTQTKVSRETIRSKGRRPPEYTTLAEGRREPTLSTGAVAVYPGETKSIAPGRSVLRFSQGVTFTSAVNPGVTDPISPDLSQGLTIAGLETQRTVQPYHKQILMVETAPGTLPTSPAVVRQRPARAWFVAVTPLYTYQQITPVHTDERYVEQIQTLGSFSGGRAGWRAQIGMEQTINKRFGIRAGLTVSQLQQSVQYSSRGASFDSARVEVLDNQSIRLTPLYRRQADQLATVRQFVGISADVIWRPLAQSAPLNQTWQPFLTTGFLAGTYTGSGGVMSGFWQASAGIERAVWPGWWLRVEPSVQYGWHTLTDSPVLTTRPYTYGLTIGLRH